ncbi:hypothetical protein B0H19DRAFT_1271460 [Mycena capillaripes]|nr:hypothetical protein B0H19DRAFT_1271460 [Mycena capillaripes]
MVGCIPGATSRAPPHAASVEPKPAALPPVRAPQSSRGIGLTQYGDPHWALHVVIPVRARHERRSHN